MSVHKTVQARYRRQRPAVQTVRADATALTKRWQLPEIADDLTLLISEVFTNAVVHGEARRGGQVRVTYRLFRDRLRVSVRDTGAGQPRILRTFSPNGEIPESGRGLVIVASVAHRWGVVQHVLGKSVWFELLLPTQAAK